MTYKEVIKKVIKELKNKKYTLCVIGYGSYFSKLNKQPADIDLIIVVNTKKIEKIIPKITIRLMGIFNRYKNTSIIYKCMAKRGSYQKVPILPC